MSTVTKLGVTDEDYEDETPTSGREIVIYKSAWPFAAVIITLIICMTVMAVLQGMGYITHKIG